MTKKFTIGIFDSGIGGLTVYKEIKKELPNIDVIYLGDTARVPYGTRSPETIKKFAKEDTKFLIDKKVDCIIVACNTVSSLALDEVKKTSNVPVFGVIEPAIKKAIEVSNKKVIGLVGTRATINSQAYPDVKVRSHASMLVPLIEEGFVKGPEINLFIKKYFKNFKTSVNTLILGCTHYPIIKKDIQRYLGKKICLVDPAFEVSKVVKKHLIDVVKLDIQTTNSNMKKSFDKLQTNDNKKSFDKSQSNDIFYLTDVNQRFLDTAKLFLGKDISDKVKHINL